MEGLVILIKTTTTLTFVTTHCFGGRHDDREIVNDEREGFLDMNGEERATTDKERGEREREKKKKEKKSDAFREGAVSTRSPTVPRNKQNKRQERRKIGVISKKNIFKRCLYLHKKMNI